MKPGFALSLSVGGISLLHRANGGWRAVGEVALDDPSLPSELRRLSERALELEPGGVTTKLIIPNDQIRYATLNRAPVDEVERLVMVRAALDGATPYALDELSFDTAVDGPRMHIAAVARETLAEAEAFAVEHGFNPVSFVAIPGDMPFLGEPFFGPSRHAATLPGNGSVEPDGVAVVVVGPATMPDAEAVDTVAEPDGAAGPDPAPEPEEPAPVAPPEEPVAPEPQPEPAPVEAPDMPEPVADPAPEIPDAPPPEASDSPAPLFSSRRRKPSAQATPPAPASEPVAPDPAPPVEASAPELPPGSARPSPDLPQAPRFAPVPEPQPDTEEDDEAPAPDADPVIAAPPVAPPVAPPSAPPVRMETSQDSGAAPAVSAEPRPAEEPRFSVTAPSLPGVKLRKPVLPAGTKEAAATTLGRFLSRRKPVADAADAETTPDLPAEDFDDALPVEPLPDPAAAMPEPIAPPPARRFARPPAQQPDDEEARRLTVFGARDSAVGGKPRYLGLVLTLILLVFLAGVAAWAALFLDDGLAGLFRRGEKHEIIAVQPAVVPAPATIGTPAPDADSDPVTAAIPDDTPLSQAPSLSTPPDTEDPVALAALPPPDTPAAPDLSDTDAAVLDALRSPDTAPADDAAPAEPLTDEAAYAATGIWQKAPAEPETPSIITLNDLYLTSIDRSDLSQDAVALQTPRELDTDQPPGAISSPAAPGTEFFLDPNGLVFPSARGSVTPDGVTVYLGPPPVKPPPTPDRPDPAAEDAEALARLAGLRPRLRPGGLVENAERAQLGGLTREELGKARPRLRPESRQNEQGADETPTALAISTSVTPRLRPKAFANIVPRNSGTAQTETVAAVAPRTVSPRIPSSASVSRQATVKNAINLRHVNLIGVYGTPSNRRALVRLPSGRYKKVKVGDSIDGGRIVAIGDSELRYQKGGRNLTLKVPSS